LLIAVPTPVKRRVLPFGANCIVPGVVLIVPEPTAILPFIVAVAPKLMAIALLAPGPVDAFVSMAILLFPVVLWPLLYPKAMLPEPRTLSPENRPEASLYDPVVELPDE
jgi:hypothetical protein